MATRRSYLGSAPATTLSADITAGATSISVTSGSGLPASATVPAVYTIGRGTSGEERVLATRSGNVLTAITRGFDNTAAASHLATTVVEHTGSGVDLDEANLHTTSTGAVHGLSGNVVGDSDTQTLTNKNLSSGTNTLPAATPLGGPADGGFAGWSADPASAVSAAFTGLVSGTVYLARVTAAKAVTIANVYLQLTNAGSGLTGGQNFAGLYRTSGGNGGLNLTLASATGDQSTLWTSTGLKTMALTAGQAVTAGEILYVAVLSNGTTRPSFYGWAAPGATSIAGAVGALIPANTVRLGSGPTGQTTLPATISAALTAGIGAWCAIA